MNEWKVDDDLSVRILWLLLGGNLDVVLLFHAMIGMQTCDIMYVPM